MHPTFLFLLPSKLGLLISLAHYLLKNIRVTNFLSFKSFRILKQQKIKNKCFGTKFDKFGHNTFYYNIIDSNNQNGAASPHDMPFSLVWIKMTSLGSFRFKWSLAPVGLFINCIRAPLTLLERALVIGPPKLLTTSFMFWFSMSSSKMHILLGCFMNHQRVRLL